jgi:hypothetical protein
VNLNKIMTDSTTYTHIHTHTHTHTHIYIHIYIHFNFSVTHERSSVHKSFLPVGATAPRGPPHKSLNTKLLNIQIAHTHTHIMAHMKNANKT